MSNRVLRKENPGGHVAGAKKILGRSAADKRRRCNLITAQNKPTQSGNEGLCWPRHTTAHVSSYWLMSNGHQAGVLQVRHTRRLNDGSVHNSA